jgi:hypothetical protein
MIAAELLHYGELLRSEVSVTRAQAADGGEQVDLRKG